MGGKPQREPESRQEDRRRLVEERFNSLLADPAVQEWVAAEEARYIRVEAAEVNSSEDLRSALESFAVIVDCESKEDAIRNLTAELQQRLINGMNRRTSMTANDQSEYLNECFHLVKVLGKRGQHVSLGICQHPLQAEGGTTIAWSTACLMVAPQAKDLFLLPRQQKKDS